MRINSIEKALCLVMLSVLAEQQTGRAQEPDSAATPQQSLFAYRSSFWAPIHDSLCGNSVLPSDVPVELSPVDPSALAHATVNSTVTFRVVRNVVVGQYGYAYAGTLVEAKVTRIREGKPRILRGKMAPRVTEVALPGLIETSPPPAPNALKLRLESSPRSRFVRPARQIALFPLTAIHFIVLVPEDIVLAIACSTGDGCDL